MFSMSFCCRRDNSYDGIDEPNSEKSPLMRNGDSLVDGVIASRRSATDDLNLWTNPDDVSHEVSEDDRHLAELLEKRRKSMTREEEQLWHNKIEEIRKIRKKVQDRWKRVLGELGFMDEQNKLVAVSSVTKTATPNTSVRAYNLHDKLVKETSIFGDAPTQRHRYAVVLDRLIDLDVVDDFFEAANELYPKKEEIPPKKHKKKSRKKRQTSDTQDGTTSEGEENSPKSPAALKEKTNGHGGDTPKQEPDTGGQHRAESSSSVEVVTAEVHAEPRLPALLKTSYESNTKRPDAISPQNLPLWPIHNEIMTCNTSNFVP